MKCQEQQLPNLLVFAQRCTVCVRREGLRRKQPKEYSVLQSRSVYDIRCMWIVLKLVEQQDVQRVQFEASTISCTLCDRQKRRCAPSTTNAMCSKIEGQLVPMVIFEIIVRLAGALARPANRHDRSTLPDKLHWPVQGLGVPPPPRWRVADDIEIHQKLRLFFIVKQ